MRLVGAVAFIVAIALPSLAIAIAVTGAGAGVIALAVVLHNARQLEAFVTEQTESLSSLKERVRALEPTRPVG
jgi:Flp pilus assembly protein TadB